MSRKKAEKILLDNRKFWYNRIDLLIIKETAHQVKNWELEKASDQLIDYSFKL